MGLSLGERDLFLCLAGHSVKRRGFISGVWGRQLKIQVTKNWFPYQVPEVAEREEIVADGP